jgi:glycosyltransferase involved in cell wall biosynthesis
MSRSLAIAGYFRSHQLIGGVASVFQNLCRGVEEVVATDPHYRDVAVTVFHGRAEPPERRQSFAYRRTADPRGRFLAESLFGLRESAGYDAALLPNYFRPPVVRARRSVTVVHDLLYKHMPELAAWRKRVWQSLTQRYALWRSDRVVTISEAVRQDVLQWFGAKYADKVRTVWNPIAFERLDGTSVARTDAGRPYLLAVAVDRPFKNLYTLIRAFDILRRRRPDHMLVLVGELRSRRPKSRIHSAHVAATMPPTVDLVRELGLEEHVLITGFVDDERLGAWYRGADLFVMPSLFEGFGMPPVESLALGTPTIVSDIPSLREATFSLAPFLRNPRDPQTMAEDLDQALASGPALKPTSEAMTELRRRFAPATIATQYLEVLLGD